MKETPPFWGLDVVQPCPPDAVLRILRGLPDAEGRLVFGHICWLTRQLRSLPSDIVLPAFPLEGCDEVSNPEGAVRGN